MQRIQIMVLEEGQFQYPWWCKTPNNDQSNATQCTIGDDEALQTLKSA
jgi:hypothetical protein